MFKKLAGLLIFAVLTGGALSFIDPDPVQPISQALHLFYSRFAPEKLYFHLDRPRYSPGDRIWFSGYVLPPAGEKGISKIVYVELVSSEGTVLCRKVLPLQEGEIHGELEIPALTSQRECYFRAYTAWMLNFDAGFFFYKKLLLGNPEPTEIETPPRDFEIRFYPEGGSLVEKLNSLVAYQAIDDKGRPLRVTGKIVDSSGTLKALTSSLSNGLGSFAMHVSPNRPYFGIFSAAGITKKFSLPAARKSGISLHLSYSPNGSTDSIFFNISRSVAEKEKYQDLVICSQLDNQVIFSQIHFDENSAGDPLDSSLEAGTPLPVQQFPPGILHVTVFNGQGQPLAERMIYLHYPALSGEGLEIRGPGNPSGSEKTAFELLVPEKYKGHFSISVMDADQYPEPLTENIGSGIRLGNDLSEPVEQTARWLDPAHPENKKALDLLLLSRTWSRFRWEEILHRRFPSIQFHAEQSFRLSGKVFAVEGQQKIPLANGDLLLIMKAKTDSLTQFLNLHSDSTGRFSLEGLSFHDTAHFYLESASLQGSKKGQKVSIEFDSGLNDSARAPLLTGPWVRPGNEAGPNMGAAPSPPAPNLVVPAGKADPFNQARTLGNVTVNARGKTRVDSLLGLYSKGVFSNKQAWAQTLDFTDDRITENMNNETVFEYMRNKIKGFEYYYDMVHNQYIVVWRNSTAAFNPSLTQIEKLQSNAPAFFVDELLLNGTYLEYPNAYQALTSIPMSRVAMIRIFQPGTLPNIAGNGPHGAVAVYLKTGMEESLKAKGPGSSFDHINLVGYSLSPAFMPPVGPTNGTPRDPRKTLYWNPAAQADSATHRFHFSFPNPGGSHRFRIIVEGMDSARQLLMADQVFPRQLADPSGDNLKAVQVRNK